MGAEAHWGAMAILSSAIIRLNPECLSPSVVFKKDMKTTSQLSRRTPLKSYTHLTAHVGLKRTPTKYMGHSRLSSKRTPTDPHAVLDAIFSQCIRRSHADFRGFVVCATCPAYGHWRSFDNGHFQRREHMATRYDPRNCAPQCKNCNRVNEGMNAEFAEYINMIHGTGVAEELVKLATTVVHNFLYQEKIEEWTVVLNKLIARQGTDIQF